MRCLLLLLDQNVAREQKNGTQPVEAGVHDGKIRQCHFVLFNPAGVAFFFLLLVGFTLWTAVEKCTGWRSKSAAPVGNKSLPGAGVKCEPTGAQEPESEIERAGSGGPSSERVGLPDKAPEIERSLPSFNSVGFEHDDAALNVHSVNAFNRRQRNQHRRRYEIENQLCSAS